VLCWDDYRLFVLDQTDGKSDGHGEHHLRERLLTSAQMPRPYHDRKGRVHLRCVLQEYVTCCTTGGGHQASTSAFPDPEHAIGGGGKVIISTPSLLHHVYRRAAVPLIPGQREVGDEIDSRPQEKRVGYKLTAP